LPWTERPVSVEYAIIIIGVLLGASRFYEWIQQKFATLIKEDLDSALNDALTHNVSERRSVSEHTRGRIRTQLSRELEKDFAEEIAGHKKRLRKWELYLIVIGTFLNGFGDYLVTSLKNHGS